MGAGARGAESRRPRAPFFVAWRAGEAGGGPRLVAAWEVATVTVSILVAEWCVPALGGSQRLGLVPLGLALAFMLASHRLRRETARDVGWRADNFVAAAKLLALPTLAFAAALFAAGWLAGGIDFGRWRAGLARPSAPALGLLWALFQQYGVQGFLNRRAQIILGRGAPSVAFVAVLFGLFHLPNLPLAAAATAAAAAWSWAYQRTPNLPALALSHSLLTLVLISTVPPSALGGLRVGYAYFF